MATWKNFKNAMKEKRTAKRKAPSHDILQKEEIVIQRLSPEVSGKVQKYSRIGVREFVPFEYDEVTLDNINNACRRHFAPVVGERMVCDVLAGEQGPSCTSLEQIPDLKFVHVRFIEPNDGDAASMIAHDRKPRLERGQPKRPFKKANTQLLPATKAQSPSKAFPKSLSVLEMMKLGKVVNEQSTVREFSVVTFNWLCLLTDGSHLTKMEKRPNIRHRPYALMPSTIYKFFALLLYKLSCS